MDNISRRKRIADSDVVNDVAYTGQSVTTNVVLRFLWHDVIHFITATSYYNKCFDPTAVQRRRYGLKVGCGI